MSPRQLLERLQSMGIIDATILDRISREIDNPEKTVKPKAMLNFLVKKGQITKAQATMLLSELEKPKPVEHDEIKVDPKVVEKKDGYDTDDLTSVVAEEFQKPARKPDPDATIMDAFAPDEIEVDDDLVTAPGVSEIEIDDGMEQEIEVIDYGAAAFANPLNDPLADPNAGFANDPYASGEQQTTSPAVGFRGKIDKKDQWATKWLYIGFGILGTLIILMVILYIAVNRQTAEDQFKDAMAAFDSGNWGDAIEKMSTFVDKYPRDDKTPIVKVKKVHALLAQVYESKNWDETIKRSETLLPELLNDPDELDMTLIRDDLSVILPNTVLAITERAKKQRTPEDMQKQLAFSERSSKVVDNPAYISSSSRKRIAEKLDKIKNNILTVKGLISKEDDYTKALVEIKSLSDQMKTDEAFAYFNNLTIKYGDLAARDELQVMMKGVSEKERDLVKTIQPEITAETADVASVISSTVVLATKFGTPVEALQGEVHVVLAEGAMYGLDAGDGSIVWRRFVGYQTSIQPQTFDEDSIIACNQGSHEVLRLQTNTGKLIWRTAINEPMLEPSVSPDAVVITTKSGKVLKLNPADGELVAACQLPQPATSSAMISETNPYIYQCGLYSNLYVLSSVDLTCKDVYYVGHSKGAISIKPMAWSGLLLVTVNGGSHADVQVLRHSDQGTGLELVQIFPKLTSGPISTPLMRFGRWTLVAADNGDMKILDIDTTNEDIPIGQFAEEKFENRDGQRPFFLSQGSQLWIGGKGIIKYKLKGNLGQFQRELILNPEDTFIAPMTKLDQTLIHVRRRGGSSMVSVSGVDSKTLKEIWETRIGGELAGSPQVLENSVRVVNGQGDFFELDGESFTNGYSDKAAKASNIMTNLLFSHLVELPDNSLVGIGPKNRSDLVYVDPSGIVKLNRLSKPADQIVSEPVAIGNDLLITSGGGQVVRLDPKSSRRVCDPFQPPVGPRADVNWKRPVVLGEGIVAVARGTTQNDDSPNAFFLLDARARTSLSQMAKVESENEIKSQLVSIQSKVFAVTAGEDGDQVVALDSAAGLSQIGSVALGAGYVSGPWALGPFLLVGTDAGEMVCFDADLKKKWSIELPNEKFAGGPQISGNRIMLPFRSGKINFVDHTNGQLSDGFDLGQPISHAPVMKGQQIFFAGADGTVHVVDTSKQAAQK